MNLIESFPACEGPLERALWLGGASPYLSGRTMFCQDDFLSMQVILSYGLRYCNEQQTHVGLSSAGSNHGLQPVTVFAPYKIRFNILQGPRLHGTP